MARPVSTQNPAATPNRMTQFGRIQRQAPQAFANEISAPPKDAVHFGGREENQAEFDRLKGDAEARKSNRKEKPKKEKKGGFSAGVGKSFKYGLATTALSVVAGIGLLAAAPFSLALSAIPGIALLAGAPVVGAMGATVGFLKGLKFG